MFPFRKSGRNGWFAVNGIFIAMAFSTPLFNYN